MIDDLALVTSIAEAHLPADVRARWLRLLKPAVRLVPAAAGEPVIARLGGQPHLPVGTSWPSWDGHGPLAYLGEIDLAAATAFGTPLDLPAQGRLLFFYFDGSVDGGVDVVGYWDPETLAGQRVVYVPEGTPTATTRAPDSVRVYPDRSLTGRLLMTAPGWEHPDLAAEFRIPGTDLRQFLDHPVNAEAFVDALSARDRGPRHQLGGYAEPVQGPVEDEVARCVLPGAAADDPRLQEEAACWELLFQLDTDDDMVWGDCGCLYWLARPTDLTAGDLSNPQFTWQCT